MATATMKEVKRQRDPELRAAVGLAREGEPGAAIAELGNRVREAPPEELGIEAGRRWLALAPEHRADTLILAPTHAVCRQANDTVREGLAEEGVLRGRTLAVDRLVNRRLTRALASDIRSYEPGDTVVFHRDVFGCRANDVCIVMGRDDGRVVLAHADGERRFRPSGNASRYLGLYDTERIELRAGDRIRWTRNRKAPPARFGHPRAPDLVNGGEAEIVEIGIQAGALPRRGAGVPARARRPAAPPSRSRVLLDRAFCTGPDGAGGDRRAGRRRLGRPRAFSCRAQPGLRGVPAADRRPRGADRAPGGARLERGRGAGGAGDRPFRAPRGGPRRVCGAGGGLAGTSAGGRGEEHPSLLPHGLPGRDGAGCGTGADRGPPGGHAPLHRHHAGGTRGVSRA